ncbi:LPXTG cell wall anchor domain-containing protein, partial [Clostridium celatum]|uniref:LPXTG cell wall anchor domain-containing protein n=2 Tax=Clostridium celatum TaxID=36834 RepID=UPI002900AE7E
SNSGSSNNNGSTNNSESNNVASGTGSNNSSNTLNPGKLPNTGGVNSLWVALTGVLAAGAGFLTRRKK